MTSNEELSHFSQCTPPTKPNKRGKNVFGLEYELEEWGDQQVVQVFSFKQTCKFWNWQWGTPEIVLTAGLLLLLCFLKRGLSFLKQWSKPCRESLMVIRGIGLQLESNAKTSFIAWENMKDFVIFEAITQGKILFYLAVLVKDNNEHQSTTESGEIIKLKQETEETKEETRSMKKEEDEKEEKLIPIFTGTAPRLEQIQYVYRKLQHSVNGIVL